MPSDARSPSSSGPEALIPDGLKVAFNTAKDAKLLTVHGVDGVGCGWLVIRFLGFWLQQCTINSQSGKSNIGIVICAFKHNIDYYVNHLQPFGIDLAWHVEKGHVTFLGNQYKALITDYGVTPPAPPSATFDASLDLLLEQSYEMRADYERAVLLLDNPEMGMLLTTDDDDVRIEKWLIAVDNATYVRASKYLTPSPCVSHFANPWKELRQCYCRHDGRPEPAPPLVCHGPHGRRVCQCCMFTQPQLPDGRYCPAEQRHGGLWQGRPCVHRLSHGPPCRCG